MAVEADWGECVTNDALMEALDRHPGARMVAVVHAETSTGVEHPLAELGALLRGSDTLLMADCVTSLAGVELDVGAWGSTSPTRARRSASRRRPGCHRWRFPSARSSACARGGRRCRSRSTCCCSKYWIDRPVTYHRTAPILAIYALHEALRRVLTEELEARWEGTPRPPPAPPGRGGVARPSSSSRTRTTASPR